MDAGDSKQGARLSHQGGAAGRASTSREAPQTIGCTASPCPVMKVKSRVAPFMC